MPSEQVSAWASYDETARSPRKLSNTGARRLSQVTPTSGNLRRRDGRHSLGSIYELEEGVANEITPGYFEKFLLEQGKSTKILEPVEFAKKKENLSNETLSEIRSTFPVFFTDSVVAVPTVFDDADEKKRHTPKVTFGTFFKSLNATMPWVRIYVTSPPLIFLGMCLRGIGQVYFQNSPLSGLLILIGMFIQSTRIAVHGVIGVVSGTIFALLLGFDTGLAESGLFGYNSFLVGLALATFDGADEHSGYRIETILATIIFSCFTNILFVMLGKMLVPYKSPPLTFPFNLSTVLFLIAAARMGRIDFGPVRSPALPEYDDVEWNNEIAAKAFFAGSIRGVGQVFLADNITAGVLVLAGIAVCSRVSAVAAFAGSALGAAVALGTGVPVAMVESGLYGFNPSLSFTAMLMFYSPSIGATVLGTLAAIMTVFGQQGIDAGLEPLGLPFMTLPFCFIALPFIVIQGTTSIVVAIPLASMTVPEDHYRRVGVLSDGFAFLRETLSSPNATQQRTSSSFSRVHSRKLSRSLSQLSEAIQDAETGTGTKTSSVTRDGGVNPTGIPRKDKTSSFFNSDARKEEIMKESAILIFEKLDNTNSGHVTFGDITGALQVAGVTDGEALHFAGLILELMDLDKSQTIERTEFVAFAMVAKAVATIRQQLARFFDFVDADASGSIDFDELDGALEYLGEATLSDEERNQLVRLAKYQDEDGSFDIFELINIVTVAKVQEFVNAYNKPRSVRETIPE